MVRVVRVSGMPDDVSMWVRPVQSGHIVYVDEGRLSATGGTGQAIWKTWPDTKATLVRA